MTDIIAFPPVGIVSWLPRTDLPVRRSRYALNGKRAVSTAGPARRMLDLTVSALARDRAGAGYIAELWQWIDGGVGLVRLSTLPQNWLQDHKRLSALVGNRITNITIVGGEVGVVITWANTVRTGTPVSLAPWPAAMQVTGLPANIVVARPGDILRVFEPGSGTGASATARVMDLTRSNGSGVAVVPLASALSGGVVSFADEESVVFEVMDYDPARQDIRGNWTRTLSLREVFASEIIDPVEVNPWRA